MSDPRRTPFAFLRAFADRFALVGLIGLSVLLLVLGKADLKAVDYVSARIGDAATPALDLAAAPVRAARRLAESAGDWLAVRERNARLIAENADLLRWRLAAERLASENAALRRFVNLAPGALGPGIAARVTADGRSPFVATVLVDAGSERGVRPGMAAFDGRGLAGRVVRVGRRSARVLLITDLNSRVPVAVGPDGAPAILAGDNGPTPKLIFVPPGARLAPGDRVTTSGQGGVLPAGVPVGRVARVGEEIAVAAFADRRRLDLLRLVAGPEAPAPEDDPPPAAAATLGDTPS